MAQVPFWRADKFNRLGNIILNGQRPEDGFRKVSYRFVMLNDRVHLSAITVQDL